MCDFLKHTNIAILQHLKSQIPLPPTITTSKIIPRSNHEMYASYDTFTGLLVGESRNDPNVKIIIIPDNIQDNQHLVCGSTSSYDSNKKYSGVTVGEIRYNFDIDNKDTKDYKISFYPDATDEYKNYVSNVISAFGIRSSSNGTS